MARSQPSSDGAQRWCAAARRALPITVGGSAQDHREPLVGTAVLRAESTSQGARAWNPAKPLLRRCAVYTRKSSEEGLEQNFNSLHAQREACEAFIKSQASEGWRLVKMHYDDGGLSGASMERPALQRLLG